MADVLLQDFLRRHRLQHAEMAKASGYGLDLVRSVLYRKRAMPEPMRAFIQAVDAMPFEAGQAFLLGRLRERGPVVPPRAWALHLVSPDTNGCHSLCPGCTARNVHDLVDVGHLVTCRDCAHQYRLVAEAPAE